MVKVSLIVPTYNSELFIRESLESAIYQTLKDIEIIIVDAHSNDHTLNIVNEYTQDKRIKIINLPEGPAGISRNAALDVAKGEYIMFLDSDDFLEPTACEQAYMQIMKNMDDVVFFDSFSYSEKTHCKNFNSPKLKFLDNSFKTGKSFHFWDINTRFINGAEAWYKIYKTSFLNKNNIRFSSQKFAEDVPFFFQVIAKANTFSVINIPLYVYRVSETSCCTTSALKYWNDVFEVRKIAHEIVKSSSHSSELLNVLLPYTINSVIYWYDRWRKMKGFPKYKYYTEMHYFFKNLKKTYDSEIKNIAL